MLRRVGVTVHNFNWRFKNYVQRQAPPQNIFDSSMTNNANGNETTREMKAITTHEKLLSKLSKGIWRKTLVNLDKGNNKKNRPSQIEIVPNKRVPHKVVLYSLLKNALASSKLPGTSR